MDKSRLFLALLLLVPAFSAAAGIDALAERYVRLSLEIGTHEEGYIDAYFGNPAWKAEAEAQPRSIAELKVAMDSLRRDLDLAQQQARDTGSRQRAHTLAAYVASARFRLDMMEGTRLPFVEESQRLFGVRPQLRPLESYDAALARLDSLVPGPGTLAERVDAFMDRYVIPPDRIVAVAQAAIAECRRRTLKHLRLPEGEKFDLELVKGKSWSAYNWYRGGNHSLIQVNAGLPVRIGSAIAYGCHEGYPGHHVQGIYSERLYRERGWVEFSVLPLFSPIGVLNEGGGNYGIELAFPGDELAAFERNVLFPLAGLDAATASAHASMREAMKQLQGASLTVHQQYLDGQIDREKALQLLQRYSVTSRARASQSLDFAEHYRSYTINYSTGQDLVRDHVQRAGRSPKERWRAYAELFSKPTVPADIARP